LPRWGRGLPEQRRRRHPRHRRIEAAMAEPGTRTAQTPTAAAPAPAPQTTPPQSAADGPGNAAFGLLADGGFIAKLGTGLHLKAEELKSKDGVDLTALPQPIPGLRLTKAKWDTRLNRLNVDAALAIPKVDSAAATIHVDKTGKPSFSVRAGHKLQMPALGNPEVKVALSEEGAFSGSATVSPANLTPKGLNSLKVTGGGSLTLENGHLSGKIDATLAYAKLGSGELHVATDDAGDFTGNGSVQLTPPFLNDVNAKLALAEDGSLSGGVTVAMTEAKSPIPALSLTAGTLEVNYLNGEVSGSLSGFQATYRGLADVTASAEIKRGMFTGDGGITLTIPGLTEASGKVHVSNGKVSGSLTLAADAFPKGLPIKSGHITATLTENGALAFAGDVGIELGPVGKGKLTGSYSETGEVMLAADIQLKIPGLQTANISIAYTNRDLSGEGQIAIDPNLVPGLNGNATVRYREGLWSGETEIGYAADDGKLSGSIKVTVAQTEKGALQIGGTGLVNAEIIPNRVRGMLTATLLPEGGVDVSGRITVTEEVELFPERRFDKELFKISKDIPLWAILVAVIRVSAGLRGGVGRGVFRNITVDGQYTIGANKETEPSFKISGEMFVPAFIEAYVSFGAGLGLDVVLGSLTGGIEGVATAGLYGAISVVPELDYENGDWTIQGDATLAAGARLKLGLNAWAEVEALWITVWEEKWKLGEWVWNVGPDLALQAHMAYKFGQPGPPELDFKTSDIDSESLIQAAMPKDGPAPSGAKEALQNKAEWKGKLKEQKPAPVPPQLESKSQAPPPAPPQPAQQPKPKSGKPPAAGAAKPGPGQASNQVPSAPGTAPPGSQAAKEAANAAATPDPSAKGTVPANQVPTAGKTRYSTPITLATIDEPPAALPRTKEQEEEDVTAAGKAVELAAAQSKDTDELDDWFPRIKNRFRLATLAYVGDLHTGVTIEGGVNPALKVKPKPLKLKDSGVPSALKKKHITEIRHTVGTVSWTSGNSEAGIDMIADPLGPDHPKGSEAGQQDKLMAQLPADPELGSEDKYIRGHLLNYDLGGPGNATNLYPITAKANSEHSRFIEQTVKDWVNTKRLWVKYTVRVVSAHQLVPLKKGLNAIDSAFEVEAHILDTQLNSVDSQRVKIVSRFDKSKFAAGETSGLPARYKESSQGTPIADPVVQAAVEEAKEKRPQDQAIVPQVLNSKDVTFQPRMFTQLWRSVDKRGQAETRRLLLLHNGFGEKSADVLFKAFKEVANRDDKTVRSLEPEEVATFHRVENAWKDIVTQIT
jgi:hypothetical protein